VRGNETPLVQVLVSLIVNGAQATEGIAAGWRSAVRAREGECW
jgi:C4-dicarboxylate-specific signal transduction histidine kinase